MKKLGAILTTSLLVFMVLASIAVAVAQNRGPQLARNRPSSGLLFWGDGDASVTFENVGESHTFLMNVENKGDYIIQVYVSTAVGGVHKYYFSYELPDEQSPYTVGPCETISLELTVTAEDQSPDTPLTITFTITAESGNNNVGVLEFDATIELGPGGDSPGNEQSEVVSVNQQNNNYNYNQY